ncbi:MAG: helix-turn-helix transcriptional regulator [Acidimicrobiia bacterium]|nr:helix-turn-helix transcriptional regulator [Acidimicrobiia bacterium]
MNRHPSRHLLRAKDLADRNFDLPLTVADMAEAAALSPAHFSREFRKAFGESPHQYLLTRRLERAAALLWRTDWSIAKVCHAVGLGSVGSFTTSFGQIHGMTPTEYRRRGPTPEQIIAIPRCVAMAYGRPGSRTFREDGSAAES